MRSGLRPWTSFLVLMAAGMGSLGLWKPAVAGGGILVTTTQDGGPGSLRAAIIQANATQGQDFITLPSGTYTLTLDGAGEDAAATGDLDVSDDLVIQGAGAGLTVIQAEFPSTARDRIVQLPEGVSLSLAGLTLARGGGPIGLDGGGIRSQGDLTLTASVIRDCSANQSLGGGVYQQGGFFRASRSTIQGNTGFYGAGVYVTGGGCSLTNVTLSGNSALQSVGSLGGAIFAGESNVSLTHCTLASNRAFGESGGIFNGGGSQASVLLSNTLLANSPHNNEPGANCGGVPVTSLGSNLSSDNSCAASFTSPGDQNSVDPRITPLGNFGGPVGTHALVADSPAVDAAILNTDILQDARGRSRVQGSGPDIGAFELDRYPAGSLTVSNQSVAGPGSLRDAILYANSIPGPHVIDLPAGTYPLGTGRGEDNGETGDIDLRNDITLRGAGAATTILDANGNDRALQVLSVLQYDATKPIVPLAATLQGFTVRNGVAAGNGGGILTDGFVTLNGLVLSNNSATSVPGSSAGSSAGGLGGAVASLQQRRLNQGPTSGLILQNCTVSSNTAASDGGGVYANRATPSDGLAILGSTLTGNASGRDGGGATQAGGILTITGSTFRNNTASSGGGGGACNQGGPSTLTTSVFDANTSGIGGGGGFECQGGSMSATGCSFTGNTAGRDGGGGFENEGGDLILTDCLVEGNQTLADRDGGGGFENEGGDLTMTRCRVIDNVANIETSVNAGGGGIENEGGPAILTDCTIAINRVNKEGGGLNNNGGDLTMVGCTVSGNVAGTVGGGIQQNGGDQSISNSTISGNSAGSAGGGLYQPGFGTLLNVTIADNTAQRGGGVFKGSSSSSGRELTLKNTLLSNASGGNFSDRFESNPRGTFSVVSAGHNLSSDGTLAFALNRTGDLNNTAAKLLPLGNNGGPTSTHALQPDSAAIDGGDNMGAPGTDQRGVERPIDGDGNGSAIVDIGAVEQAGNPSAADLFVRLTAAPSPARVGQPLVYTVVVQNAGPDPASQAVVRVSLPSSVDFISSNPDASNVNGNLVTFNLGNLAVDATRTIRVTVRPRVAEIVDADVNVSADNSDPIKSNNQDTDSTEVRPARAGRLRVTPKLLAFGNIGIGRYGKAMLTLRNDGDEPLSVELGTPPRGFQIRRTELTLEGGETARIPVYFVPTRAIAYSGRVRVTGRGLPRGDGGVPVRLTGTGCR